jgi:hypothetical protein
MANALYDKAREAFLKGQIDWTSDTIKVALVSNLYTPNLQSDDVLSKLPTGSIIGTPVLLDGRSASDGIADGLDVTFNDVTVTSSTGTLNAIVIYKARSASDVSDLPAVASPLIAYLNQINGLPITSASNNSITIHWDNGTNKIFKL